MTGYRTILACLSDADTASATLGLSFLVGREFAAHVEALHVRPDAASAVPLLGGEGVSGAVVEELLRAADRKAGERAVELRRQFDRLCASQQVPMALKPEASCQFSVCWHEEVDNEEEVVATRGRLADLVVMARPDSGKDLPSIMSLNAALMESGRPVLLAPPRAPDSVGGTIAVFWNGSAEASRAVALGMPFLERARRVIVLSATEEQAGVPEELASYLAWHGITAEPRTFTAGGAGGQVGNGLLAQAASLGADLVVMGAYTHSRLRQLVMGGVTRHVLYAATLPVLLSH
jgi:nucleotide-binding universal stress UspA family protein